MNEHRGRNALTVAGAVALALAAAAASAETAAPNLEAVIVTAQKRAEALADIPMSVSVLPGEALERQKADNFQDLVALIPGLSINTNTRGVSRISLRGINTGGVASTVGIYVDDVPFGSSSGLANGAILSGDFDTYDMARIEVLRGPQGTLYGASSLGGVIKYVANEPSTAGFEAKVQGSVEDVESGGTGSAFTGVVNIPAGETFAFRASGYYRSDDGFVDSIGNNPIPSLTNPDINIVDGSRDEDNINGLDTYGGRLSALFKPSENFSLNVTALFQDIRSDNADIFEADPTNYHPLYGGLVASNYHPEYTDIDYRVYSATIDWNLGPVTFQSVTSYGTFEETLQRDVGGIPVSGVRLDQLLTFLFSDPVTVDPALGVIQNQVTSTDKFTQEFRLVSRESDSFEWLLGLYYTDEDSAIKPQLISPVIAGTEEIITGFPVVLGDAFVTSTYQEFALFGNATWHVTDRFDVGFGGRWSDNDQEASQALDGILVGGTQNFADVKSSESPFTYSFSPRFEITDGTSVYARIATGFRPGGPNVLPATAPPGTPASYDSDELTSYELGVKSTTADGRFSLDAAVFFLDWKDIQLFVIQNNVGFNGNGGTAESQGFEFTASARVTEGLSLTLTGAYTDADLTEDTDPAVGGLDGNPLPWVPDWQLGLAADYEWSVFADSTAYVGGQVAYTGDRWADFGNRTPSGSIRKADAYTTVDLRTGLLRERWSLEFYGKNVTNERGVNDIVAAGIFPNGAVGIGVTRPRTIGLSLGLRF